MTEGHRYGPYPPTRHPGPTHLTPLPTHPQVLREKHRESVGSAGSVLVASASLIPVEWDKAANWQTIERTATEAAQKGAGLVLMSEGFLEGYVIEAVNTANATFSAMPEPAKQDLLRRFLEIGEPSDGPYLAKAKALTKKLRIWLQFGFLHRVGGQVYNGVALFDPDGDMVNLCAHAVVKSSASFGLTPSPHTLSSRPPLPAPPLPGAVQLDPVVSDASRAGITRLISPKATAPSKRECLLSAKKKSKKKSRNLTRFSLWCSPSCYTPGSDYPTAATPFARVGHLICFDRHFPEIVRSLAVGGATLILNPSCE